MRKEDSDHSTSELSKRELHTVKFLSKEGVSLDKLVSKYFLKYKYHSTYSNKVFLLKYDQMKSPFSSPIVQECRGLILESVKEKKTNIVKYRVLAYPYQKFFNYNEPLAAKIDWSTARVSEKLDGSLCTLYYYDSRWWVSSSGTPCASGMLQPANIKFSDLFWDIWHNKLKYKLPTDTSKCYMFEMMSYRHTIIVQPEVPKQERIVLHGIRSLDTLEEEQPESIAKQYGWECIKFYPLNSLEEVVRMSKTLNPVKHEGYVVCDANFNRIKVKSPQYVALAHLSDNPRVLLGTMNSKSMLQVVRFHEGEEFLGYFPAYKPLYDKCWTAYKQFIIIVKNTIEECIKLKKGSNNVATRQQILKIYLSYWTPVSDGEKFLQYCHNYMTKNMDKAAGIIQNILQENESKPVVTEERNNETQSKDKETSLVVSIMHFFSSISNCSRDEFYELVFLKEIIKGLLNDNESVQIVASERKGKVVTMKKTEEDTWTSAQSTKSKKMKQKTSLKKKNFKAGKKDKKAGKQ